MHDLSLVFTLTIGLTAALALGYASQRAGLSPILGYLLAGVVAGPFTPGPVADARIAAQLAEVGVVLLMFGVGLHFHPKDLLAVRGIAVPGAVAQSAVATALGAAVAWASGWNLVGGLVLGTAISVASTVVLIRGLEEEGLLDTSAGRIAVGWLIVEDLFTVLVLVVLPVLVSALATGAAGPGAFLSAIGLAVLKLALLPVLVLGAGGKVIPWLLTRVARTRSRELFTLAVLSLALAIAAGSAVVFGASMALGAFLAGMVVGQSKVSEQAAADALPFRDAFAVLFFVSVGMLFDPAYLLRRPLLVLGVLAVIVVAKPLVAFAIAILRGYSVRTGLIVAAGLSQIGEFSFILAQVAVALAVLPEEGQSAIVAAALLSISVNPLLFRLVGPAEAWMRAHPRLWSALNRRAEARGRAINAETAASLHAPGAEAPRAIVVGYGPVGRTATKLLREFGIQPVIVDMNIDTMSTLVAEGATAIYGDAGKPEILRAAGIAGAKYLVVTLPTLSGRLPVIVAARHLNPDVQIFSRARYLTERAFLERMGVSEACYEEAEAAARLAEFLLRAEGTEEERIRAQVEEIREELALHAD
ncbi:MAG: cation:proton antiporter [Pseudomonadota bacterium]|nr:cation:proton antiporter [Pseudomonadota bacterium]